MGPKLFNLNLSLDLCEIQKLRKLDVNSNSFGKISKVVIQKPQFSDINFIQRLSEYLKWGTRYETFPPLHLTGIN